LARKIIYRKIIFDQDRMRTNFVAKQGRWVYERGGLEQDSKSPRPITRCICIEYTGSGGLYKVLYPIATTITAKKVPS
jgi:hypothetical protein